MSIIYDFPSIAKNLRDDRWLEKPKGEPPKTVIGSYSSVWETERMRRGKDKHALYTCSWCLDIGFPRNPHNKEPNPCRKCGKEWL